MIEELKSIYAPAPARTTALTGELGAQGRNSAIRPIAIDYLIPPGAVG